MSSVDWCVAGLEPEVEVLKGDAGAGNEDGGLVVGVGVAVGHGLTGMLPQGEHRWVAVEVADDDDALVLQPLIKHALHERGTLGVGQGIDEDKGPLGLVEERRHVVEQSDLQFHIGQHAVGKVAELPHDVGHALVVAADIDIGQAGRHQHGGNGEGAVGPDKQDVLRGKVVDDAEQQSRLVVTGTPFASRLQSLAQVAQVAVGIVGQAFTQHLGYKLVGRGRVDAKAPAAVVPSQCGAVSFEQSHVSVCCSCRCLGRCADARGRWRNSHTSSARLQP